jgi:uncharacterized protein YcbK (DUF882 family)
MSYFSPEELKGLDQRLIVRLIRAREYAQVPFVITSGKRTPEENAAAGGVKGGAHERGLAVDMAAPTSRIRFQMVRGLITAGFNRVGVYDRHVHADVDDSLPQQVLWVGTSH